MVYTLWNNFNHWAEYNQIADLFYMPEGQVSKLRGCSESSIHTGF